MGLEDNLKTDPPCHPLACAIQGRPASHVLVIRFIAEVPLSDCLAKNSYQQDRCQEQVNALYKCCDAFYQRNGDEAKTVSCPKANLLRLKMKQQSQGI
ncbi:MAG: hypothetical protein Q9174_000257 [Haloplaca sp. 1 TL-2023]